MNAPNQTAIWTRAHKAGLVGLLSQAIAYRRAAMNLQAQTHTVKGDGQ